MKTNPFDDMETPQIAEETKQAIARADAVMTEANLPTYTDLLEGLNKLWRRTGRPGPISVAWFHEHITPLMPK